jgi:UDP:flavonoid glycosyltransferase YjiC (YdhE family)
VLTATSALANTSICGTRPNTDVAVSTGGLNTGHEALWFGVPMLNLPIAGIDTAGNSARLCLHGVARRLTRRQITVPALAREMTLLLDDPGYRERARALSVRLRAWDAVDNAARAIESAAQSAR